MPMYFVAILAPDDINCKALEWKHYMLENFGCRVAMRSPAHITLIPPFNMSANAENELIGKLAAFSKSRPLFSIHLKDFGSFPPRVIFVDVQQSAELTNIKADLEQFLLQEAFAIKKDARPFHPHVTIANRDLDRTDLKTAWDHFKFLKYEVQFVADAVCLLRGEKEGWKSVARALLGSG